MKRAAIIKRVLIVVVLLVVAAIATYVYYNYFYIPEDPNVIRTSGVIEAVEVRVGTKIGGVITELLVEEGDQVEAGDVIARIDTVDLNLQLEGALAVAEQARALLQDVRRGMRSEEIEQLETVVRLKEANLERARLEYDRRNRLAEQQAISQHEADIARTVLDAAQRDLETAQEQVRIARLGSREDRIAASEWSLRTAEANTARLRQQIVDAEVNAPISGRVSIKNMERGEIARPGATIVTLVDLDRPWVRVFVPENRLGRVRLGMTAEVLSDSFPDRIYTGIIRHIATEAEFTPKNVQTEEERIKLVYAVRVYVDNPNQELKPGQPVDAIIRLDQ